MVTVIILTKNEEKDIGACLDSVDWCDDVHVVDSGSTDRTVAICEEKGARVWHNPFTSFGQQRNWALDHCARRHEWILFLDADERSTPEFRAALADCIAAPGDDAPVGYYCCWKTILEGRWLKRCDCFPRWQLRLLRHGRVRFTDFGHGQKEDAVDGELGHLRAPYLHYAFSKGWSDWIAKHNRYSDLEAKERFAARVAPGDLLARHSSRRNPALKVALTRVPLWPALRFGYTYVLKLGFLEGIPGLILCLNMAVYEYFIIIKYRELARAAAGRAA